jgi:alanyl-tRNA synthetase
MKKRTAAEIREAFLSYFEKQGHRRVPLLARAQKTPRCRSPTRA